LDGSEPQKADISIKTLIHYMVLASTKDEFGLQFSKLNIWNLVALFKVEFDLNVDSWP